MVSSTLLAEVLSWAPPERIVMMLDEDAGETIDLLGATLRDLDNGLRVFVLEGSYESTDGAHAMTASEVIELLESQPGIPVMVEDLATRNFLDLVAYELDYMLPHGDVIMLDCDATDKTDHSDRDIGA